MGNIFASLHFIYLVGKTTVHEIVRGCSSVWNGQKATDMSGKTNYWMNIVNVFYQGMQFPNCVGAMDEKLSQIQMPAGSESVFYNFRHFFLNFALHLVDANFCCMLVDVGAIEH
jgi:hypothetical protein